MISPTATHGSDFEAAYSHEGTSECLMMISQCVQKCPRHGSVPLFKNASQNIPSVVSIQSYSLSGSEEVAVVCVYIYVGFVLYTYIIQHMDIFEKETAKSNHILSYSFFDSPSLS